jgi:molybdate transport system substrate-binding protein
MNVPLRAALFAACIPALILAPAQTATAQDTDIRVLCSNGFRGGLEKLLPHAERATGRKLKVQFGTSASFKQLIEGGEPFDLAIVTPQIVEALIKEGKIADGTKVDLASSGIGIAVRAGQPKPDISSAQAIKQVLLDAKSIGIVKVGAGTPGVMEMVNRLGISDDVTRKTAFQTGADESLGNLAKGQVSLAFGLVSEILPAPGVQLAGPLPPEFQKRIILSAGIASSTKNREIANKIIKDFTSAAAAASIKAAGLDPIEKEK